ncbi:SGNH hydrolase-type esterase domain-containing protein [Pseudomassariella vexata]|uniref:SGNH hydrolase-type esterase domain-containing protein n=1 Tax=Pseudomassariella vexata TaxID=1141098 RepID=A0A1Y2DV08_9PEZI|nr:SGNH hydrolase-type esterase domain-containing protein [Pseudomassariella vexata]ORY62485.1 SGNH hydrolase-type esterase domain-containing protein [Pseudomassariella vexata]
MATKPFRILCFGNSLTSGHPVDHPYALMLKTRLEKAFPTLDVQCTINGVPGDLVTRGTFMDRLGRDWKRAEKPFDWTIVLGGTNDIGWGYPAEEVAQALKKAWDIPLSRGGKVLALTIPECRASSATVNDRRNSVNKAIKAYKRNNFYAFDLFDALPYHSMEEADQDKYWGMDGLHLTESGYDLMGSKIAKCLVKIINLEEAQSTEISSIVTDARQRRMIEDLIFEEERGDPKLLSQGYIVVRKSDLD